MENVVKGGRDKELQLEGERLYI